ncbi:hypothetical protein FSW04_06035 [Baekduia soli]|uniref:Lipoprotein n=1 Tax=Baekduia soli TaxID=496014 RepID=A0A5B8U2N0_9ACTN|nr:hypothetical protein [Baekduia soli]QEC47191.1 hypothetical protein FSW04_06035 [Baekduia soli]
MERAVVRRRRLAALAVVGLAALGAGVAVGASSGGGGRPDATERTASERAAPATQLPGGGRRLFPDRRVVAFYGNPRDPELGALGIGTPAHAARRLLAQARPYDRRTRHVLPALELISTVATAAPGPSGLYRDRMSAAMIDRYLAAARRVHALLVLDIQPGRGQFGPEIERLARWLREPDVGLALDPEWHVGPGQLPGKVIGSTDADVVNAAAGYLSRIVRERALPEKLLLVHRFTDGMITRDERLRPSPGVATVVNVDGFGSTVVKVAKYHAFIRRTPTLGRGFKLFYKEDVRTMAPGAVMALSPRPDVVVYE